MKTLKFLTFFCLISSLLVNGQQDDWIVLTTPQSGIIGAPVKKIKGNDINFDFARQYDQNPKLTTRESASSKVEYEDKFRNFATKFFTSEKSKIQNITAYNLEVRTLSQEAIGNLQLGGKYIYEGVAADSVEFTIAAKKEFSSDISKAVNSIAKTITNPETTKIVEKVAPILDSISYTKNDSVFFDLKIKNPNVYYKIKLIKLKRNKNPCGCDWETNCFLHFAYEEGKAGIPETTKLSYSFAGVENRTIQIYPEFCGKDIKEQRYFLKLDKDDEGLHLWVYGRGNGLNSSTKKLIEVPYEEVNGKREWRLERTYLDRLQRKGIIKNVFVEVSAKQLDDNSLEIINYEYNSAEKKIPRTTLKYPDFKGKYVTK